MRVFPFESGGEERKQRHSKKERERGEEEKDKFEKCSRKKNLEWKPLLTP